MDTIWALFCNFSAVFGSTFDKKAFTSCCQTLVWKKLEWHFRKNSTLMCIVSKRMSLLSASLSIIATCHRALPSICLLSIMTFLTILTQSLLFLFFSSFELTTLSEKYICPILFCKLFLATNVHSFSAMMTIVSFIFTCKCERYGLRH